MEHNYIRIFLRLFFLITVSSSSWSQNCNRKIEVAEKYLSHIENPSKGLLEEISNSVKDCYDESAESYFVKGVLRLNSAINDEEYLQAFQLIDTAALFGSNSAACQLGVMYKSGIGCNIDFEKSVFWFEKAAEDNNERAMYSLGYMYLKGLGTIPQDYKKALQWFDKSNHPMSKHWSAVCKYFGFGQSKVKDVAIDILDKNGIKNSSNLLEHLTMEITGDTESTTQSENASKSSVNNDLLKKIVYSLNSEGKTYSFEKSSGSFLGTLVELDWSGSYLMKSYDVRLKMDLEEDKVGLDFEIDNASILAEGDKYGNGIYPENFVLSLPYTYADRAEYKIINWNVGALNFDIEELNGTVYTLVTLDTWSPSLDEPGPPLILVLSENPLNLSIDELEGLANQNDSFIKLYPNPIENQFLVQYDLKTDSECQVTLYNLMGYPIMELTPKSQQSKGTQNIRINSSNIPNGNYIVKLQVGDKYYSKIAIKK